MREYPEIWNALEASMNHRKNQTRKQSEHLLKKRRTEVNIMPLTGRWAECCGDGDVRN
jgi:hypothetical protein